MNLKCTSNEPQMNLKWTSNEPQMNLKWTSNEPQMNQIKCGESEQYSLTFTENK